MVIQYDIIFIENNDDNTGLYLNIGITLLGHIPVPTLFLARIPRRERWEEMISGGGAGRIH